MEIGRGQLVSGRLALAEETGLSERQIRTSLNKLKSTSDLTTKSTNRNTLYTLCNYDLYQDKRNDRPAKRPANSPASDQQATTNNNDNNDNNITINTRGKIKNEILVDIPGEWKDLFSLWLDYKSDRKEMFKNKKWGLIAFDKLVKMAGEDVDIAREIVEKSITNNWAGLFELKTMKGGKDGYKQGGISRDEARDFLAGR